MNKKLKPLNDFEKFGNKRRRKVLLVLRKLGSLIQDIDDFSFKYGEDMGALTSFSSDKVNSINRIRNVAFWEGVLFALENEIIDEKDLMKRLDISSDIKTKVKGGYIG